MTITPIVAHFKPAKLRWRFISRPGVHLNLTLARREYSPTRSCSALLPRRGFVLFFLPIVLGGLLAVIYSLVFISQPVGATHGFGGTTHPHDLTSPTSCGADIWTDIQVDPEKPFDTTQTIFWTEGELQDMTLNVIDPITGLTTQVTKQVLQPVSKSKVVTATYGTYSMNSGEMQTLLRKTKTDINSYLTTQPETEELPLFFNAAGAKSIARKDVNGWTVSNLPVGSTGSYFTQNTYSVSVDLQGGSSGRVFGGYTGGSLGSGNGSYSGTSAINYDWDYDNGNGAGATTGSINTFIWNLEWILDVTERTRIFYYTDVVIPNLDPLDPNSGTETSQLTSATITSGHFGWLWGRWQTCTRNLIVELPVCSVFNILSSDQETFDSLAEGGTNLQTIDVYPVGPGSRSGLRYENYSNTFGLSVGGSYTYSRASPYDSGEDPVLAGRSGTSSSAEGANWTHWVTSPITGNWEIGAPSNAGRISNVTEPTTSRINFPGHYTVTWVPSWSSNAASIGWAGSEVSSNQCRGDTTTGTLLGGFTVDVWVYADPPTCAIDPYLFEVNEPIVPRIILTNSNQAPMWVDRADLTISRPGFTRTDSATTYVGQAVPAGGNLPIEPTVPPINFSGNFTLTWTLQTNMGVETWTTLGTPRPPQRSWFADPEERIVDSSANACQAAGSRVIYRPFIKVFYGGLAAGGQFGSSHLYSACGKDFDGALGGSRTVSAFVAGHTEGSGPSDARGSSAEYTLQAFSAIGGFYSASQRASPPAAFKGLTLANNGGGIFGGDWNQKTCIANYWREVERLDKTVKPSPLTLDIKAELGSNERRRYEKLSAGEKLELTASAPLDDLKATLYVEGDVYIKEDIVNNGGHWHDPSEIGYLSIIVKGNIYIDPAVEQIDALLVAYPKLDSANNVVDGRIYTCWYAGIDASATHFNTCNKQLVVNGALIAEKVLFGRVFASVQQEALPTLASVVTTTNNNIGNILGADRNRLCQIALSTYPADTDIERLLWPYNKYSIQRYSGGLYPFTYYFKDYDSSLDTCDEVGYLLETNVLRGTDDGCGAGRFCWGNRGPAIYSGSNVSPNNYLHNTGYPMSPSKYSSNGTVTRGRFAMWLARALNGGADPAAPPVGTPSPFTDVDETQDWWPHVYYLANHPNIDLGHLSWPYGPEWTLPFELPPWTNPQGTFTYSPSQFRHRGFASSPTEFHPNSDTTAGWAGIITAKAFAIPADPNLDPFNASPPYYLDISRIKNLNGQSTYIVVYLNGIVFVTQNLLTFFPDRNDPIHYLYTPEVVEAFRQSYGLYTRDTTCYQGWQFCDFRINATRKSTLAQILASAMAYSGIRSSGSPPPPILLGGSTPAAQYVRTTKAAEVINLLPEYFIGKPELPLFADQVYKTDSFLNKPSNF